MGSLTTIYRSCLSFYLPELVQTSPAGDGPPIQEWVLVGVAGSSQLGSNKRISEKVAKMHCIVQEPEANRQALQEARSEQALDRRVRMLKQELKISRYSSKLHKMSTMNHSNYSNSPNNLYKQHKLRNSL